MKKARKPKTTLKNTLIGSFVLGAVASSLITWISILAITRAEAERAFLITSDPFLSFPTLSGGTIDIGPPWFWLVNAFAGGTSLSLITGLVYAIWNGATRLKRNKAKIDTPSP
ncbi:MAG TPA: hypothetical protein VF719_10570 [Abditibacteriaceae bacterium]